MKRRDVLKVFLKSLIFFTLGHSIAFSKLKKILKNDEDWKKVLTPEQFNILRREGTERPFSSILNNEYREGDYVCIACETKLFHSSMKYDSGTGWPSFTKPINSQEIIEKKDTKLGMTRTEVRSSTANSHLGHVFNDGPKETTGIRHCVNSVALVFKKS